MTDSIVMNALENGLDTQIGYDVELPQIGLPVAISSDSLTTMDQGMFIHRMRQFYEPHICFGMSI
jgi:hypothetical protein